MNYQEVLDLMDKLEDSSIRYIQYQTGEGSLELSKDPIQANSYQTSFEASPSTYSNLAQASEPSPIKPALSQDLEAPAEVSQAVQEAEGEDVLSPMVGVVYLQPDPDSPTFVKVGDQVQQGDVLVIIEAMKLMNEIQAPVSGTITDIYVTNESVVEFNQPLVRIQE
ncbi:acetyl-CoA carboxylase biotin carboxyl carrier protein [Hutsoniella sourekii]